VNFRAGLLGVCLLLCLAVNSAPAFADDVIDPKLAAQLAQLKSNCAQAQAEAKAKAEQLEAAKAAANIPPQKKQEIEQKLTDIKAVITKTETYLHQPLPATQAEQETYLKTAYGAIADARIHESMVARDLGLPPSSPMEVMLSRFGESGAGLKDRFGRWDGQHAMTPDMDAPMVRAGGNSFFGVAGQLPPSAIPSSKTYSAYAPTNVELATKISNDNHGVGGGVMLEGLADGLDPVSSVDYDKGVNALVLNGNLIYFVKIPPWSLATMCREIGSDRNGLVGVSETGNDGLLFGDKPEIYQGSDLAYELLLADKFLGDIIFARRNSWTQGYKFPTAPPAEAKVRSQMLVRFAFGEFKFAQNDGQLSVVSSALEVRMMPVSKAPTPTGQFLPDYNAMDNNWKPPDAFVANARILAEHIDYFRQEALIQSVFADAETAAVLRSLKQSGRDLNALADSIDAGQAQ